MHLGKGIKESAADKLVTKLGSGLHEGESVALVCKCNNLKPLVDRVVVTNQRLLAAAMMGGQIKYSVRHNEVKDIVVETSWSGTTLAVTKTDGTTTGFKSMEAADAEAARAQLQSLESAEEPDVATAMDDAPEATTTPLQGDDGAVLASSSAAAGVATAAAADGGPSGGGTFAKWGSSMKKAVADAQAASQERAANNRDTYGKVVMAAEFGPNTVEIYETGFVRVGLFLTTKSPFEKLRSISFSTQVQDKSAGGRALAAGLSMGLSTLASNEKRLLFLTIATDRKVHTLQVEGGMTRAEDKAGLALEAAGKSVLESLRAADLGQGTINHAAPAATVGDQLRQLAELHKEGILSDEEFGAAKTKLLGQL